MTDAVPPPARDFAALALSPALLEVVGELGFTALTPVQALSIPLLLEGRDVVGQSRTGSGKTVAFVLPLLQRLELPRRRLQALVLCPTRELCAQVVGEVRKLGRKHAGLRVLTVSGGQPGYPQRAALAEGVHVVVGTPGRCLDHLERGALDLRHVHTVVLDEADRMLDMGFRDEMEKLLAALPAERQTVFFSATFPPSIAAMSEGFQRDPARIVVEEAPAPVPDIEAVAYEAEAEARPAILAAVLRAVDPDAALVFCNFKATVATLAAALLRGGFAADALHGDLDQPTRDRVLAKFRNGTTRILVATDVAARGLDIQGLDLVVNYELPAQPEIYVHRVGRTGRAGARGRAVSLASSRESGKLARCEAASGAPIERREVYSLEPAVSSPAPKRPRMATLFVFAGRKDKLRPGDLLGALTGDAGFDAADIGRIEIHDRFAYVAVSAAIAETALRRLADGKIKGRRIRVEAVR